MAAPKRPSKKKATPSSGLASSAHSDTTAIIQSVLTEEAADDTPASGEPQERAPDRHAVTAAVGADHTLGWAPLAHFAHRPSNPRTDYEYDPERDPDLEALRSTYEEFGLLQPVSVTSVEAWLRNHPEHAEQVGAGVAWIVVMGNRRLAGARHHGLDGLPYLRNDQLAVGTKAGESSVIENYHRKGTDPIREAAELLSIMHETGESRRALASRLGVSHGQINQRLTLLDLIPEFQGLVSDGELTVQKALPLARLAHPEQRTLLQTGPPYTPNQLHKTSEHDQPALATRSAVTIKKHSTPEQIVDTLQKKFTPELMREVTKLLHEPPE